MPKSTKAGTDVVREVMSDTDTIDGIEPKAVMSEEEIAAWSALPADVQLSPLRAAIDQGIRSGVSERTMDEILEGVLARHRNGEL